MRIIAQLGQTLTEKDLGALLDALNHTALVSMTDGKGNITYANRKFVEVSQYPLEELLGKNHRILKSGEQPDEFFADLWRTIVNGGVWRGEIKNRAKDGSFYWVDTAIAPILDHKGASERYISVRFLITDRKREELAKSQFASLASHQLRTPLSAIRWSLSNLRMSLGSDPDASAKEDLDDAERTAIAMEETIETLLLLSQLQSGKVAPALTRIQLPALLESVGQEFRRLCDLRTQRLLIDCPADLPMATDDRLLREILHNLVSNALKYSPDGSDIRLRASSTDSAVRIDVEDSGIGIPVREQDRVSSMFFRADNAVDAGIAGTGLGLHLTHSLVQLLHGRIAFTSTEGEGTTFTLLLPFSPSGIEGPQ